MTVLKRSTGGLLQSEQRSVRREDFENAARFIAAQVGDNQELSLRLGLPYARRFAEARIPSSSTVVRSSSVPIEDLQRKPRSR